MIAGGFSVLIIDCTTVLFPQPDSPTRPNISPFLISKETSFTACTGFLFVMYFTSKFFIDIKFLDIFSYYRCYAVVKCIIW